MRACSVAAAVPPTHADRVGGVDPQLSVQGPWRQRRSEAGPEAGPDLASSEPVGLTPMHLIKHLIHIVELSLTQLSSWVSGSEQS